MIVELKKLNQLGKYKNIYSWIVSFLIEDLKKGNATPQENSAYSNTVLEPAAVLAPSHPLPSISQEEKVTFSSRSSSKL